jgi:hypothetical protein
MPYKDPDPTDPNVLVGVMLPAGAEATRDMAYVFAEEFARFGYTREQLLGLFKNPFYGGAHGAYRALGENETLSIIDECLNVWGSIRITVQDVQNVQNVQPPPSSSPASAGEGRTGGSDLGNGLNGAQRLNDLNVLNQRREEQDDE